MSWQFHKALLNARVQNIFAVGFGVVVIGNLFMFVAQAQAQASYSNFCAPQNTLQQEGIVILGKVPNRSYVVIVPVQGGNTLDTVRTCIPDAFESISNLGAYVHAGAFSERSSAESLSRYLRSLNLDARVVYSQ